MRGLIANVSDPVMSKPPNGRFMTLFVLINAEKDSTQATGSFPFFRPSDFLGGIGRATRWPLAHHEAARFGLLAGPSGTS